MLIFCRIDDKNALERLKRVKMSFISNVYDIPFQKIINSISKCVKQRKKTL